MTAETRLPTRCSRSERGAAVFVVVLAITLLTAVGLFAAHSATLVDQAAGYARMARQTQYLAEYGTLAGAAELGSGSAEPYFRQMLTGLENCRANTGLNGSPCYKIFFSEIEERAVDHLLVDQSGERAGIIGYSPGEDQGVAGDFVVELTDPGPTGAPIAGTDLGGSGLTFRYLKVTATTTAHMRPSNQTCDSAPDVATLTGQQSLRAHLVIGPVLQ